MLDRYTEAMETAIGDWGKTLAARADTVYLGGGTPSLLGGNRIARLLEAVNRAFDLASDAEITMEANPADDLYDTLCAFRAAGGNRLSLGMQSTNDEELADLGRRHRADQTAKAVDAAHRAGITHLSLDLMLALSRQTADRIDRSVDTCHALGATHVSAYLLKIEPNTPFGICTPTHLPDEDGAADLYLHACRSLERAGYRQYEISNFARDGQVSRHNLKYWNGDEYIGIGPAAHSMIGNRRFAYARDLSGFIAGHPPAVQDSEPLAGSPEEYAILRLRLTEGLTETGFYEKFGRAIPKEWRTNAQKIPASLCVSDEKGIRLTQEGFLVSNAITVRLVTG